MGNSGQFSNSAIQSFMKNVHEVSPYDCSDPTYLFVGFEEEREECLTGLQNGHSSTILGGLHCGKTAFLHQLEQDIREYSKTGNSVRLVPYYLDIQDFDLLTPAILFERMYELIVRKCQAPAWRYEEQGGDYSIFLAHVEAAKSELEQRYGTDWIMVFLFDELDAALFDLPDDQFFYDLRHLVTASPYHDHFRIVATGVKDMLPLISENAPLDFLTPVYLRVLYDEEVDDLILTGFPDGIEKKAVRRLLRFTGGHPYLLHSLLENVWQDGTEVDETAIKRAKKTLSKRQQLVFDSWLNAFGMLEHYVYQLVIEEEDTLTLQDVYESLPSDIGGKIEETLAILGFHGVIDLSDPDDPQLAGTIFRDWYQDHSPVQNAGNILETFTILYEDVERLPVDDDIRQTLWEALEEWLNEQPTDGGLTPSSEKAVFALEEIRGSADAITTWIEQLEAVDAAWHWG